MLQQFYDLKFLIVANKLVELVEAETTQENNFMPPEIRDLIKAQLG